MSDYYEQAVKLVDLAMQVSGGSDLNYLQSAFEGAEDVSDVREILRGMGIRWARIVEEDVAAVLSGHAPQYFLSEQAWAKLYRERRDIREYHNAGEGYACFAEQQYFYGTQEWKNRAKAARFVAQYQCERCGARNTELHVHHLAPIISVYHYNFDLNFQEPRLEVLCRKCHLVAHSQSVRGTLSYCFISATSEEVREEKARLYELIRLHDSQQNCPFCQNNIAEKYPNTGG
jgi:5-methylcytosine-specific restriction endonuclease McrA